MRRRREKKRRPPFPLPKGLVLLSTPDGWRCSVLDVKGGIACGALPHVPAVADPREARAAAALMVRELARDFHGAEVDVVWEPPHDERSWTAEVRLLGCVGSPGRPGGTAH